MSVRTWRCRRVTGGVKCNTLNLRVKQKCTTCGGPRPKPRPPAHRAVLAEKSYEEFVAITGGEHCGICGKPPKPGRRLHRDHDHLSGAARGVLCFRCNSALRPYMTLAWLLAAVAYLERAASHIDERTAA